MSTTETSDGKQIQREHIPKLKLCIASQDGKNAYFRVRRDIKIQRLLLTYCKEKDFDYNVVEFLHYGTRIQATKTPHELGMEDEDVIEAMIRVHGGGYWDMHI